MGTDLSPCAAAVAFLAGATLICQPASSDSLDPATRQSLAWQLALDGYGIHGTPWPSQIGKTGSHGCFRLTNWDAARLAAIVKPGTPVRFIE
jgi:lipoprotein-anchoring transpeptidase ErfK/SrfK